MRVSRGPGRQRSQSSLFLLLPSLPPSLSLSLALCLSLTRTLSHIHTHTWLCSHGASVSVIAACHPYLSTSLSLSPSLCCRLSLLLRDVLLSSFSVSSFLHQIKGPALASASHSISDSFYLSLGSMPADCLVIHTHLALPLFFLTRAKKYINISSGHID